MNTLSRLALIALAAFGLNAFAEYTRLAECTGRTQTNVASRAVIFVDNVDQTSSLVLVTIAGQGDYLTTATVDWKGNSGARVYNNDFDLDILIDELKPSTDDALVNQIYIPQLRCVFSPNK